MFEDPAKPEKQAEGGYDELEKEVYTNEFNEKKNESHVGE